MKTLVLATMMMIGSQAMALDFNKEIAKHSNEVEVVQLAIDKANKSFEAKNAKADMQLKLIAVSSAGERRLNELSYLNNK